MYGKLGEEGCEQERLFCTSLKKKEKKENSKSERVSKFAFPACGLSCPETHFADWCQTEQAMLPVPHATSSVSLDSFPTRQTSGEDFQVPFLREKPGRAVYLNIKWQVRQTEMHRRESKMQSQEKASGPRTRQEDSGKWIQAEERAQNTKFWSPRCWWKKISFYLPFLNFSFIYFMRL